MTDSRGVINVHEADPSLSARDRAGYIVVWSYFHSSQEAERPNTKGETEPSDGTSTHSRPFGITLMAGELPTTFFPNPIEVSQWMYLFFSSSGRCWRTSHPCDRSSRLQGHQNCSTRMTRAGHIFLLLAVNKPESFRQQITVCQIAVLAS